MSAWWAPSRSPAWRSKRITSWWSRCSRSSWASRWRSDADAPPLDALLDGPPGTGQRRPLPGQCTGAEGRAGAPRALGCRHWGAARQIHERLGVRRAPAHELLMAGGAPRYRVPGVTGLGPDARWGGTGPGVAIWPPPAAVGGQLGSGPGVRVRQTVRRAPVRTRLA